MDRKKLANHVVAQLGGPSKTARYFDITPQAVNNWLKRSGLPHQQIRCLRRYEPALLPESERGES